MMDRMNFVKVVSVWLSAAFATFFSGENIELAFKVIAYALAAGYTAWRWLYDFRARNTKGKKE